VTEAKLALVNERCETDSPDCRALALAVARALLALQTSRGKAIGVQMFSDPAWDMLLDLFVAAGERRTVCVSSLCLAANIPVSTAHRWVQALARAGAITRREDPLDRRRVFVELPTSVVAAIESELLLHHARISSLVGIRSGA
jgi:DNA-binding MarR family transcriptional regulator